MADITAAGKASKFDITARALPSGEELNTIDRPIDNTLAWWLTKPFDSTPAENLGSLTCLPLELVYAVCLELDIKSCVVFRQVNRRARQTVSNLVEYRSVTTHALSVLQAVFWSGMAPRVTAVDLYRLLCNHECMVCSSVDSTDCFRFYDSRAPKSKPKIAKGVKALDVYHAALDKIILDAQRDVEADSRTDDDASADNKGGTTRHSAPAQQVTALSGLSGGPTNTGETTAGQYLFLPTLTRCCKPCLEESPRLRVVPLTSLRTAADLPRRKFTPVMCTPWFQTSAKRNSFAHKIKTGIVTQENAAKVLFDAGFPSARVQNVLYESGYLQEFCWVGEIAERDKFTAVMPFLDRGKGVASGGFTCRGCEAATQRLYGSLKVTLEYTNTVYGTDRAFFDHIAACPEAKKMLKEVGKPQPGA